MKSLNLKAFTVITLMAVSIIISVAATKPSASKIKSLHNSISDTGHFKNLQVLPKNISKDSLDMIMDGFKAALGVRCNFCHAMKDGKMDFASDDKEEKGIARYMMKMTTEINTQYFNFEKSQRPDTITVIKCVTCHRQNPHPDEVQMSGGNNERHDMMPPPQDSNHQAPPSPGAPKPFPNGDPQSPPPVDSSKPHN